MRFPRFAAAVLAILPGLAAGAAAQPVAPREVAANDNRRRAGTRTDGALIVNLVAGRGEWRPEKGDGPALDVAAFGEEGGPLLTPGPLLRVPEGTEMIVRVKNTLGENLSVHGFLSHPPSQVTVLSIPAGETREARFSAGAPGTYYYWGTTGGSLLNTRRAFESQLGGALVVDPRGDVPSDRVLVMTEWDDSRVRVDELVTPESRRVFAINGFSWPHTERLDERVGQTTRWRIVNLTQAGHPMHLHGFYFDVEEVGTGLRTTAYQGADRRHVVTEQMPIGATMVMSWTPERSGNWLLHCHLIGHVTPALRYWRAADPGHSDHAGHGSHDVKSAMAGLVMGIRVTGETASTAPVEPARTLPRRMTLAMRKRPAYWHPEDAYAFSVETNANDGTPQDAMVPGPLLVLHRGEPVEITLKNQLPEATAIHWHGIELESYFDGVPGWSGSSVSTTRAIVPGGSFVVRFTPPRAGTFMYHTHSHDLRQLASGLYGAIVVLDPGEAFDPARDHVLIMGMEGPKDTQLYDRFPVLLNGSRTASMTFKAGVPNRLRLINITTNFSGLNVSVMSRNEPLSWRPIAKDGADLPVSQQKARPALGQVVGVGETYDFVVDPPQAGQVFIDVRRGTGEWVQQIRARIVP